MGKSGQRVATMPPNRGVGEQGKDALLTVTPDLSGRKLFLLIFQQLAPKFELSDGALRLVLQPVRKPLFRVGNFKEFHDNSKLVTNSRCNQIGRAHV